jgi:phage shock protein PspC (stress-responsive transcriptional regulator)
MIDGVCGGVAGYFGVDSTLVRVVWALLTFLGGSGVVLYLACMILMPKQTAEAAAGPPATASEKNHRFWGILLIVVGGVWLLGNIGIPVWHGWWGWSWDVVVATLFIMAGVALVFGGRNAMTRSGEAAAEPTGGTTEGGTAAPAGSAPASAAAPGRARLFRSRSDRKFLGVCGGMGAFFEVDSTIVRLLTVAAAFASFGIVLLAYFLMALVLPQEPLPAAPQAAV